ncbi:MAG TPA: AAA family ATPase [Pirellulales bacterium]|nr:AAA family ATPase [Pirellulales bacterium]
MPVHRECPSLVVRPSSDVERCSDGEPCFDGENGSNGAERVEWLWPRRLALGQLSILAGGTMSGKSFLSADLAARVSNGFDWPDALGHQVDAGNGEMPPRAQPARVLIVTNNPSRARRLGPRLAAAGADLNRVVVDQVDWGKIPNDEIVASIEEALARAGHCKLVIYEPPPLGFASRGAELDEECAAFFQSLSRLAARRKVAVLAVVGLRHDFSAQVSKRQLGALASCGAAMSVWAVLRDEASPALRYLVATRSPDADDQTAMAFRIRQDPSCAVGTVARVEWRAKVLETADGASRAFGGAAASRRALRIDAIHWLKSLLRKGGMPVSEIQREAKGAGYSWATVRRARQELFVRAYREYNGCDGHWFWKMGADVWLASQGKAAADDKPRPLPEVELVNLATMKPVHKLPVGPADGPADAARPTGQGQGAQLAGQDAQLAREISGRLTPAARQEQGAQLAGQDAQVAREATGRLTPAARQEQGAQLAREIAGRLTPGHPLRDQGTQLTGQDAQLAREITGRLTPAARRDQGVQLAEQGAQLARENGRAADTGGPRRDLAAAKAKRLKRKEKKKMRRLVAIGRRR